MGLIRTVEPAELAVALADAKKQCEIGGRDTTHDSHLTRLIKAATADVERHTRRALVTQTWRMTLKHWPSRTLLIPRPPLQAISSVVYIADDATETTLNTSLYQVSSDSSPAFIEPAYGEVWPTLRPETKEPIKITFVAGFGDDESEVPEQFKNLIYELVAFRFMNRGDAETAIPKHVMWAMNALKCGAAYGYYGVTG